MFHGCRILVWDDEKVLEVDGGDSYMTMQTLQLKTVKVVNIMYYLFYHIKNIGNLGHYVMRLQNF